MFICLYDFLSTLIYFYCSLHAYFKDSYDLIISIKKTEVVYQPAPGRPYKKPTITVKGQRLYVVDKFTYVGSTLS